MDYKITKEDIWGATENGKLVFLDIYPQSEKGFMRRNFSIREGDRNPSCCMFQGEDGTWLLQDKGGTDTKAYNAIALVMRERGLSYPEAMEWIAGRFAPQLLQGQQIPQKKPEPIWETGLPPQNEITVEKRDGGFTREELKLLGRDGDMTEEICAMLNLFPVKSVTYASKDGRKSSRCLATPEFPIFYYDYGTYGKIYQPKGELRFMWTGDKNSPERRDHPFCGDADFMRMWDVAKDDKGGGDPFAVQKTDDDDGQSPGTLRLKELIICSGPSDGLNLRCAGYHVCWPNSETAEITDWQHTILSKIAMNLYILYDMDATGVQNARKVASKFLDIRMINLPFDLPEKRTAKGGKCKDVKDYFIHYYPVKYDNQGQPVHDEKPYRRFRELMTISVGLRFWNARHDTRGRINGYEVNNEQLYAFLEAFGYRTIEVGPGNVSYCHVKDNRVRLIDKAEITVECTRFLQKYIVSNPVYYSQGLVNSLYRSPQLGESSLKNLSRVKLDFRPSTYDAEYFFFENGIAKVSAAGISMVDPKDCPFHVYEDKIIRHSFRPEPPMFEVGYTQECRELEDRYRRATASERKAIRFMLDSMPDIDKYELSIHGMDFDFASFVYNTGRTYWEKEESGTPLTDDEKREHDLNFIAKVAMIGYMLSLYKEKGHEWGVYVMEMEQSEVGEHKGGTGKSLLMNSLGHVRNQLAVDGRNVKGDNMNFILQRLKPGITDTVYIDDLNNRFDLHNLMNWITGSMEVEAKYADQVSLEFEVSPKLAISSNHAISGFDDSLRRRMCFAAYSSYYHEGNDDLGLVRRTPLTEFGRPLLSGYGSEDMNRFYNFMLSCVVVWKKFHARIQPVLSQIETRTLVQQMGQPFKNWADDYFDERNLNTLVNKDDSFAAFRATLTPKLAAVYSVQTFKKNLQRWCRIYKYTFNPACLMRTQTERSRNDIRKPRDRDHYYYYIDTTGNPDLDVWSILGDELDGDNPAQGGTDDEQPPF